MYRAENGSWYCKVTLGRDPLTGKRVQVTKRGFPTAADAAAARRQLLDEAAAQPAPAASRSLTVDELLGLYLDGIDADGPRVPGPPLSWLLDGEIGVVGNHLGERHFVSAVAFPLSDDLPGLISKR